MLRKQGIEDVCVPHLYKNIILSIYMPANLPPYLVPPCYITGTNIMLILISNFPPCFLQMYGSLWFYMLPISIRGQTPISLISFEICLPWMNYSLKHIV